jgi:heptaprenyl diphosphate synthase
MRLPVNKQDHLIANLTVLAIGLHLAESALPSPIPGIKPGLANIITVMVCVQYGWRSAAWVTFLRVLVGSIVLGTFLSPTFILSLSGSLAAVILLRIATLLPEKGFGPVGYSLLAALAHMASQIWVAYHLFVPHPAILGMVPLLMTMAIIFGIGNGILAALTMRKLEQLA